MTDDRVHASPPQPSSFSPGITIQRRESDKIWKLMRIAVLGLGFMGSTHLKALRNVAGATLAAVVRSDDAKLDGHLSGIQGNLGGPGEQTEFSGVAREPTVRQ